MKCYASKVIGIALDEVGYLEKESNRYLDSDTANVGDENFTKYARDLDGIKDFYNGKKNGYAWCDVFVDWCFVQAFGVEKALELLGQSWRSSGAGCGMSAKYFKQIGCFYTAPKVGDQIFFKNSSGTVTHTGLVYKVDDTYVYTVEGNTSSASGVVANGGGVFEKKYKLSYKYIYGYGRPLYNDEEKVEKVYVPTVLEWQKAAVKDGFDFPRFGTDGKWGSECTSVAKKAIVKKRLTYTNKNLTKIVQKVVGVTADGLCGANTQKAIIAYQKAHNLEADGCVGLNTWKAMLGIK